MKKKFLQILMISLFSIEGVRAQDFNSLKHLQSPDAKIYFSAGHDKRAKDIAKRVDKSFAYFRDLLRFRPAVTLLVLDMNDWAKFASPQFVYGMPHFDAEKKTLYVAAIDNPFWKSFIPPMDKINPDLAQQIKETYKNESEEVSMQPFFDLLAIHELGHAFHLQRGLNMQRNWMGELFVNILLHTYIAEKEPKLLPALTIFPKMVLASGASAFTFTSLKDVHEKYQEITTKYPKNYGWYQCRLHAGAAEIYNAAGKNIGKNLWESLQSIEDVKTDNELASILETTVHKSVADLIRNWDIRTK